MLAGSVASRPPRALSASTKNQQPKQCRACSAARPGRLQRRSPPPAAHSPLPRRAAGRLAAAADPQPAAGDDSDSQAEDSATAEQLRQLQEQQQLFEAIEQCVQQAEELEAGDKLTEAINLVQTGALAQLVCLPRESGTTAMLWQADPAGGASSLRCSVLASHDRRHACLPPPAPPRRRPWLQSWRHCRASTATTSGWSCCSRWAAGQVELISFLWPSNQLCLAFRCPI